MKKPGKIIINSNENLQNKIEILKKIYNINVNTKLIEHIFDLEILRFGGYENLKKMIEK